MPRALPAGAVLMSDDKVIHAFPNREPLPECPVDIERRMGFCGHKEITLVEHDRSVVCAKCGATLDPFDYLVSGAQALRYGWQAYRMVEHKHKELSQRVDDLVRERNRLTGIVKRLKDKAGAGVSLDVRKPL